VLFAVVNLARWLDVDAESALREANVRFIHRFCQVEQLAAERGIDLTQLDLPALDKLWQEVKAALAKGEMLAKVDEEKP
jgi:ATP diphosphatase